MTILDRLERHRRTIARLFFATVLAVGIGVHRDYGASWDDAHNRTFGLATWRYAVEGSGDRSLIEWEHGVVHGPFFELALIGVEKGLGLTDLRDIYFARHLATFLLFFAGLLVFYRLLKRFLREWTWRLFACLLAVLTPRLFADAFYNSVDVGGLVFFVFAFHSMLLFFESPSVARALWHGIVCAMAVDTRMTSVLVPAMTLAGSWPLTLDLVRRRARSDGPSPLHFQLFLLSAAVFTTAFWPYLWTNPIRNFFGAMATTASFQYEHADVRHLYLGAALGRAVPWHYNFVWMAVTIPISTLLLFVAGAASGLRQAWRSRLAAVPGRHLALVAWLAVPLLAPIILKTTLYNGWRHHFFVYPAFLIVATLGLRSLVDRLRSRPALLATAAGLIAVELLLTLVFMIRSHPYQHVHFNALTGGARGARGNFELDYWGLSLRRLLERVAATDPDPEIAVSGRRQPLISNRAMLPPGLRARFKLVGQDRAKYVIGFNAEAELPPAGFAADPFATVEVDGVRLAAAFRR